MLKYFKLLLFILLINKYGFRSAIAADEAINADDTVLDEVVVTAPQMDEPLTVTNDPKAPQQPVPANDGAAFLRNIPGFSMIRKGGTDGDPVFRGLAGSRLNIVIDGAEILGGCGQRMDPPTAYVFPEIYDRVTVLKGPQTVRHGNGNVAGVVLFDRDFNKLRNSGTKIHGSAMGGVWGRVDGIASGSFGAEKGFAQATISHAESGDYKDGDGRSVHSKYKRQSISGMAGWTPNDKARVIVDAIGSRAEAAYADRAMDGKKFDRHGVGLKAELDDVTGIFKRISAQVYYNYIDHVMDNYSLRNLTAAAMVNNPDRETQGARVAFDLQLTKGTLFTLGLDWQTNIHTIRRAGGAAAYTYENQRRIRDMDTSIWGMYAEMRHDLSLSSRLIAGLRYDQWSANRYNDRTAGGTFMVDADATLSSGFLRYEHDLQTATIYIGIGHAERPMDYWEASTYQGLQVNNQLDTERNTQVDVGILWDNNDTINASASLFYSHIDNYVLTQTIPAVPKPILVSHNVNVKRWGGEFDGAWRFIPNWTLRGSLAYVWAANTSMNVPLAQTPPLEGRLGLDYTTGPWTFAGLVRMAARQDRVHVNYGNIVGRDLGQTSGFTTVALNASYKPSKNWLLSAGVDNLLDRTYSEHISRGGFAVDGFVQTTKINEPGRFWWLKVTANY